MKRTSLKNFLIVVFLIVSPLIFYFFTFGFSKQQVIAAGHYDGALTTPSNQHPQKKLGNAQISQSVSPGNNVQRRENPLRSSSPPSSPNNNQIALVSQTTPSAALPVPQIQETDTFDDLVGIGDFDNIGSTENNGALGPDLYSDPYSVPYAVVSSDPNRTENGLDFFMDDIPDMNTGEMLVDFGSVESFENNSISAPSPMVPTPNSGLITPQNADPLAAPSSMTNNVVFPSVDPVPQKLAAASPRNRPAPPPNNPKIAQQYLSSEVTRPVEGTGLPGPDILAGPQIPQLILEKILPSEIQVNRSCIFKTVVRNGGKTAVKDVLLRDFLPKGTRFVSAHPAVVPAPNGELVWALGTLQPNDEITVELELIPIVEGEIGSVATLQYSMEASGKTVVTRPILDLEIAEAPDVLIGENVTFNLILSNPGTGVARGVELELQVPDGLVHEKGQDIIFTVGELKPKEVKRYPLTLRTVARGKITSQIRAKADNGLESVATYSVQVIGPELILQIDGPRQRFLESKAAYTLRVGNPGTASAQNVALSAYLPSGLQFVSTNQNGVYDQSTHTVHWALEELPARESGEIELITLPVRQGEHAIKFEGIGQKELRAETTHAVNISGLPALSFAVSCLSDPVEVGKPATYEVALINRGTRAASNVAVSVRLPEGMIFANAEGPSNHRLSGNQIQFAPLSTLDPKQEKIYRFTARCMTPGDQRVTVSVISDDLRMPITKEESTQVFGDQ